MTRRGRWISVSAAAGILLFPSIPATAQTIINGRTARENAQSAGARAPGNMVSTGMGRAQAAVQDPFVPVEITETSRSDPVRVQALVDAIGIIFDQLDRTLLFLGNRLAARAGLMELLPVETFFPPVDTSGGTDGGGGRPDRTDGK